MNLSKYDFENVPLTNDTRIVAFPILVLLVSSSFVTVAEIQWVSGQDQGLSAPGVTSPVLKDADGEILTSGSMGSTVFISFDAVNGQDIPLAFMAIMEARGEDYVTYFLGLQEGLAPPGDFTEVTAAWTPEKAGNYQLRTFLISGFENPMVLSEVRTSDVVIAQL